MLRRPGGALMPRVKVFCVACRGHLLTYRKQGRGALVKLHPSRIAADHTAAEDPLSCPRCATPFARAATIGGQAFRRLIGGKVFVKGGVATR